MTDDPRAKVAELTGGQPWPGLDVRGATARGCRLVWPDGRHVLELSAGASHLLGYAHPTVVKAVQAALDSGLPAAHSTALGVEVAWLLRAAFPGTERIYLCEGHHDALRVAFLCASGEAVPRHQKRVIYRCSERPTLRGGWLRVGDERHFEIRLHSGGIDELERRLDEGSSDAIALALDELEPSHAARARAIAEVARRRALPLVIDEWATAFRTTAAGRQHELGLQADLTVVGGGLAGGMPFGAVLGSEDYVRPGFHAQPLALAAARATLEVIAAQPIHRQLAAIGERWRAAFAAACAEHGIHARLEGPPASLRIVFDGQENADPQLLGGVFLDELRTAGAITHGLRLQPCAAMSDDDVAEAEDILRRTVARLRTLLIEHNSYLSGGLAWAFPGADTPLAARGLAIYRFPAAAEVDVVAANKSVRISFAEGDLGDVTSSGFYVPTRVRGDFVATAAYRLESWRPGPQAASFALFAQNEPSTLRYYAQRRSAGDGAHELLANFNNVDLSEPQPVTERHGALRVQRRGDVVSCWHRCDGGDWVLLGEHRGDPADDVILGAKIWSSGTAGALEAVLSDLRVDGEIPIDQLDAVPVRPDPRGERNVEPSR